MIFSIPWAIASRVTVWPKPYLETDASHIFPRRSRMSYEDKTIVCVDCGAEFTFTADEQQRFAERGFTNEPKRCKTCRDAKKAQQGGSGGGGGGYSGGGGGGRGGY